MATETLEPLLTPQEVADILKIKVNSVYVMNRRGILKSADIGLASIRFRREDVEALIARRNGNGHGEAQEVPA